MIFNNTVITKESIDKARRFFINNLQAQMEDIRTGKVKVNNKERHLQWLIDSEIDCEAGAYDNRFTMLQRAYYIQTGDCVALLPE